MCLCSLGWFFALTRQTQSRQQLRICMSGSVLKPVLKQHSRRACYMDGPNSFIRLLVFVYLGTCMIDYRSYYDKTATINNNFVRGTAQQWVYGQGACQCVFLTLFEFCWCSVRLVERPPQRKSSRQAVKLTDTTVAAASTRLWQMQRQGSTVISIGIPSCSTASTENVYISKYCISKDG